jgi:hypothetical protein
VSEPALNRSRRHTGFVVHRCENFSEPMQFEPRTDRMLGAGKNGAVVAVATVQPRPHPEALQDSQEVSIRVALSIGEDQPRVREAEAASAKQLNE